jgi:hypothetical protein
MFAPPFRSEPQVEARSASLVDDHCDSFTVGNLAESVAGFFDGRFTRCE